MVIVVENGSYENVSIEPDICATFGIKWRKRQRCSAACWNDTTIISSIKSRNQANLECAATWWHAQKCYSEKTILQQDQQENTATRSCMI